MYVFSADINYDFGNKNYFYIDLMNGAKTVYTLAFKKTSTGVTVYDMSSGSATESPYGSFAVESGWFNLRIEYYPEGGDSSALRFKTYINGELAYVSDNYVTANAAYLAKIDSVAIRCYKTSTTKIYLDNVGFSAIVKENEDDTLGAK